MDTDQDDCELCDGCGEIEAHDKRGERQTVPCPTCVSRELRADIDELRKDKVRLDWLETQVVNVRTPLVYGSRNLFWASGDEDGEPLLRITIDNFMDAEKPTLPTKERA